MKRIAASFLLVFVLVGTAGAEEIKEIFGRVEEFVTAKNYTKALEELTWAKKEIEKMHTNQLKTYFPDEVAGYSGEKLESNNVLGITNLERTYRKAGDSGMIKVSLTGGSGGSAGGFGGLAALGNMAAMMQGASGEADTFRIDGRTASITMNPTGKSGELTVFLNSGSILKVEMQRGANEDTLRAFARELKLNDMDNYLKGAS